MKKNRKRHKKRRKQGGISKFYQYGAHGELLSSVPLSPAQAEALIARFEREESLLEEKEEAPTR